MTDPLPRWAWIVIGLTLMAIAAVNLIRALRAGRDRHPGGRP